MINNEDIHTYNDDITSDNNIKMILRMIDDDDDINT